MIWNKESGFIMIWRKKEQIEWKGIGKNSREIVNLLMLFSFFVKFIFGAVCAQQLVPTALH